MPKCTNENCFSIPFLHTNIPFGNKQKTKTKKKYVVIYLSLLSAIEILVNNKE